MKEDKPLETNEASAEGKFDAASFNGEVIRLLGEKRYSTALSEVERYYDLEQSAAHAKLFELSRAAGQRHLLRDALNQAKKDRTKRWVATLLILCTVLAVVLAIALS